MYQTPRSARPAPARLLVVAAAGYGKTTALDAGLGVGETLHQAVDLRASLPDLRAVDRLYVDDLQRLSVADQETLMSALTGLGPRVRLTVASRSPLAPSVRALMPGPVFERGPADLALSPEAVACVLRDEHGLDGPSLASRVHATTGGWPALVHFAGDVLSRGRCGDLLGALAEPGAAAATWLEAEVLAALPEAVGSALAATAGLGVLHPELLTLLSPTGSADTWSWLRRSGLLVSRPARRPGVENLALVPVVAEVVASRAGVPGNDRLLAAARSYADNQLPLAAAEALVRAGHEPEARALVVTHGEEMLAAGEAAGVVRILRTGTPGDPTATSQQLLGDALRMSGDAPAALRAFAPQVAVAEHTGTWPPGLVARVAKVHYMLADYSTALEVLDRVDPDSGPLTRDGVELLACRADVLSMLGREEHAAAVAGHAAAAADQLGDDRATAAARLAAANTSTGAAKEAHLAQALAAAQRAGDVVLTARALLNKAYALLCAARYDLARDVAREAVGVAERGSPPGLLVIALHNLGEALRRLGHHAEAELHLQRSVGLSRELGLRRAAFGLWGIAEIHRELGRRAQSAIAYESAVDTARESGEVQVLVPALSGLARLRAQSPAELDLARAAAAEAERLACPEFAPYALLASGWVDLAEGDREGAARGAAAALSAARSSASIDALAESLELAAEVEADPRRAWGALEEALAIWDAGGAAPAADRVRVRLARLPGADVSTRSGGRDAAKRLVRHGIHTADGHPFHRAEGAAELEVRVLGGFEVRVGGDVVPVPAWRSKQARTLVKILVSRRGRVITRSEVCELLWPDDEPARTGHRLSVLLSAARGVLDPDRGWPPDHFIAADLAGLSLDLSHVRVDVEQLLQDAAFAADLLRSGDPVRAAEILAEVDSAYVGEALEDEPYAGWADGLREEARSASMRCLRHLAEVRARAGDHHEAATLLVRLLVADPYDENAHRGLVRVLVRGGRHGEARRAFARWEAAMRSIDAPIPNRRLLRPHPKAPTTRGAPLRTPMLTPR